MTTTDPGPSMQHQQKHLRAADPVLEGVLLKVITSNEVNKRGIEQIDTDLVRIEKKVDNLKVVIILAFIVLALLSCFNTILNGIALTKSAHAAEDAQAVSSRGERLPDAKD